MKYHKTHFMLGTNCYMFWQQGAIIRQFLKTKDHMYFTWVLPSF